jgi:hypothetical protein
MTISPWHAGMALGLNSNATRFAACIALQDCSGQIHFKSGAGGAL